MAKENGIGMTVTIASNAITNDVLSVQLSTPKAMQIITGLDKSAMERLTLLADASCTPTGVFNDASSMSHATLKAFSTAKTVALAHSGQTLSMSMMQTDYQVSRGADGAIGWTAPFSLADGTVPAWS